jgi:hypothetical protein
VTDTTTTSSAELLTANLRSFLTSDPPRHATIATVNPDGSPHQIVIWFELRGDEIVVNSRNGRRWPSNVRREGRANLCIYQGDDAVTLDVALVDNYEGEPAQADIAAMAHRYYVPEVAAKDIERFRTQQRVTFVLRPTKVLVHGDPR